MSARETAELLLLVGRRVQAEGYDGELSPAQWMALRYFARANPFSRTPSAFAAFQATTRGTASQAIKALEASGYLVRQRSKADGRSVSLRLTSRGKKALARDPFEVLVRAVDALDASGHIGASVFARTVRTSVKRFGATSQLRTPHHLSAHYSEFRYSQRTRIFSAFTFSQRASTAMANIVDDLGTPICWKEKIN